MGHGLSRGSMVNCRVPRSLEYLVAKGLGRESAPRGRNWLFSLVLGREISLADAAAELAVCDRTESAAYFIYSICEESVDARDV